MTREEYLAFHRTSCDRMVEITKAKNADYTSGSDDPFFNFTRIEAVGIASTEVGFLTRMFDKFARITTFVKKGVLQVSDESVEDTLFDLANYCILLAGFIRSRRLNEQTAPETPSPPEAESETNRVVASLYDAVKRAAGRQSKPLPADAMWEQDKASS